MSVITKDLGVATAYGYAKSKGYTGTEEEFAELMASYADVAQQAEAAAQDAEDAKDAAITAKTAAQTAQTAAESAQAAAAGSAQTASTKATEASNSAQTAAGSATAAGDSATTAQTAAQTATTKASEASSSASAASTAKTGAETARTGAQTAQTAAETAQANAEAAASSVSASAAQIEQNTEEIGAIKNDLSEKADKSEALSAYITETETGSIASFTDGADDVPVKDLQVAIEPVQSGSGDPSPSNVRPISGWTGANVTRTGKNLLTQNAKWYYNDNIFFGNHTNNNMPDGTFILPAGTYTASSSETMTGIYTFDETGTSCGLVYNNTKLTFVNPKTQKFLVKFYKASTTEQEFANINLQLEVGSTATAYEPYQGETYEVDWTTEAGTVYGGILNVTTGALTVDRAMVDLGTLNWNKDTNRAGVFYANVAIKAEAKTGAYIDENWLICDTYKYINESVTTEQNKYVSDYPSYGGKIIFARDTTYTESAEFNTGVSGHYVAYKLAQTQTYQLTPQEVSTILGQNNIFADTGNVTVQYRADTKLYIDKVLNT